MMPHCSISIQLHVVMIEIAFINISSGRSKNDEFSMRSLFTRHQHAGLLHADASLWRKPLWHGLRIVHRTCTERHQGKHAHGAQPRRQQLVSLCMVWQGYLKRGSKKKPAAGAG